jgi:hypothetical protein
LGLLSQCQHSTRREKYSPQQRSYLVPRNQNRVMLRVDRQCCKNFLLFQQISIPAIPLDFFILGSTKRSRISIHVNGLKQTKTCIRSFWIFTLWSLLAKKKKDHESIQPILYYASPLHCYSHLLWRKRTGYKLASVRSTEPQPVGSVVD